MGPTPIPAQRNTHASATAPIATTARFRPWDYALALAAVGMAAAVRMALNPLLGEQAEFLVFTLAILVAGWRGGLGPGLFATALSAVVGTYLLVEPFYSFSAGNVTDMVQIALLVLIGVAASLVTGALHSAYLKGESQRKQLLASEERLEVELEASLRLHDLSIQLIQGGDIQKLYDQMLATAATILHADFASMQLIDPAEPEQDVLRLLAQRGFHPQSAQHWTRVGLDSNTSYGMAFASGKRFAVQDIEQWHEASADDLAEYRRSGIRAMQSTPLRSRSGSTIGVISTHWRQPHEATPNELRTFDILARQVSDLLERTHSEQALRRRSQQFEALLNGAPLGVYLVDADFRIVQVNPVALPVFGSFAGGVIGRSFDEVIHVLWNQDYADKIVRIFRHTLETGESYYAAERPEFRLDRGAVENYQWWLNRITLPDGRHGLVCYFRETTDEMRARQALRDSEERFRILADSMPQLVWTANQESEVTYYNSQAAAYQGIEHQDDGKWAWHELIHPEDLQRTLDAWQEAVGRGSMYQCEHRMRMADGSYRYHLSRAYPVASGDSAQWFGTATDVHDLKMAEKSLLDADRRKDEFLATLAHELRNPLAPVRNAVDLLTLSAAPDTTTREMLGVIDRQITHMVRLIDDLLDISRITRGSLHLRKERVEVSTIVEAAVEASRPQIEAARHRFTLSLPSEPVYLDGDPVRLIQVLSNLLINAAKYSEPGGQIWLTGELVGPQIELRVKDTGIGIPPDHLPKLFDIFSQVQSALDRSQGGLGIGLALVRGLVEMHDGTVEARSEGLGRGSEFIVRLPVCQAQHDNSVATNGAGAAAVNTPTCRVLVVDDSQDNAHMLAMLLKYQGHEVKVANDGAQAVEAVSQFRPRLVLMDIGMPGMNGYEAARRIRQQHQDDSLMLVAMTGWGQEEDKRLAKEAGFDLHLTKPIDRFSLDRLFAQLVSL